MEDLKTRIKCGFTPSVADESLLENTQNGLQRRVQLLCLDVESQRDFLLHVPPVEERPPSVAEGRKLEALKAVLDRQTTLGGAVAGSSSSGARGPGGGGEMFARRETSPIRATDPAERLAQKANLLKPKTLDAHARARLELDLCYHFRGVVRASDPQQLCALVGANSGGS